MTPTLRRAPALLLPVVTVVLLAAGLVGCGTDGPASSAAGQSAAGNSASRKVTVAGDSISYGLGSELRAVVPDSVDVKVISQGGTGLARPDKFDWPARLATLAREFPPTTLVFTVGSNDHQDLTDADGDVVATMSDHAAWDVEYSRRLASTFDQFRDTGTKVVWVGQVRTDDPAVAATNRHIHQLATQVASSRPWVTVADLSALLGVGEKTATSCLIHDGLHLTAACYRRADMALVPRLGVGS